MEFDLFAGWLGGFVGTIAMTLLMMMGTRMGMSDMPPMPVIQGAMFTDDESTARRIGLFTHVIVMGTLVFGTTTYSIGVYQAAARYRLAALTRGPGRGLGRRVLGLLRVGTRLRDGMRASGSGVPATRPDRRVMG